MTPEVSLVFAGLAAVLAAAGALGWWLARRNPSPAAANLNARIRAWWVMIAVGGVVMMLNRYAIVALLVALFALLAWFALAEFVPRGWFFAAVPLQFLAVALQWEWLAAAMIPALCLVVRERDRRIGLLLCVYGLSFASALSRTEWVFYFVLVVQASDVLQYLWGKAIGRRKIAPHISPGKTVEGLLGGIVTATALGSALHGLTPFGPAHAAAVSLAITLAGFAGGLLFSAIKRQRGIKDWGTAIAGHGGVLDRVDSLCLSAPVFYLAVMAA